MHHFGKFHQLASLFLSCIIQINSFQWLQQYRIMFSTSFNNFYSLKVKNEENGLWKLQESLKTFQFIRQHFTWNQFWGFSKCKTWNFDTFGSSEFWFLWIFALWGLKFTILAQFTAPTMTKMAIFENLSKVWVKHNQNTTTSGVGYAQRFTLINILLCFSCVLLVLCLCSEKILNISCNLLVIYL